MDRIAREAQPNPELLQISRRLTGLSMKRPGLAFGLYGEPGIGKTYTSLALLRGTPCQTKTVHATQTLEKTILQLPRPKKLTLWLEKILERLTIGETLETGILNQALAALLAANAPIILHVEDLHEASFERLEFWNQLAQAVTRTRGVGLFVTSRVQPPESFEAIRLSALNRAESDALLEAEASAKLPSEALVWLFERAAGNPLFTLEFFRLLARNGSVWNDGHLWRWRQPMSETMPVTVEALIEQTLLEAVNTPMLQAVLAAKAMLGANLSETLWVQVTELTLEDFFKARTLLETRGVLANDEFSHPLYGEVIAGGLSPEQRQRFARKALEVLEDQPAIAAEFIEDANLEPELALKWFDSATEHAARTLHHETIVGRLLERSVRYRVGHDKAKVALEAAKIYMSRDLPAAVRMAELALEYDPTNSTMVFLLAEIHARRLDMTNAETTLDRLIPEQRSSVGFLSHLIELRSFARKFALALEIWDEYKQLLSPILNSQSCYRVAFCMVLCDREQEAFELVSKTLADHDEYSPDERANLLSILAMCHARKGAVEQATVLFSQIIIEYEKDGQPRRIGASYFNLAVTLGQLGRCQEQLHALQCSLKNYDVYGDTYFIYRAKMSIANTLVQLGQYESAEDLLLESRPFVNEQDLSTLITYLNFLCNLYSSWAMPQSKILCRKYALAATETARRYGNGGHLVAALSNLINTELDNSNLKDADCLSLENIDMARTEDNPEMTVSALRSRSLVLEALGRCAEAITMLEAADQIAQKSDFYVEAHLTGLELARLKSDPSSGLKHLAWFEERGLMTNADKARRYFLQPATDQAPQNAKMPVSKPPHLEVLGSMQIKLENQPTPMRGRKRQELLALLLEARISGRSEVSKLELVEKLYPDADEIQSNAGLRDVIYQLRSSLGEGAVTTTANGYALGNLSSDIEDFLKNGDTKLWRGTYLEGLTLETSDTVRESVYLALRTRAETLLETDPVEVTRVGRILCEADLFDLEAVRLTLTGLRSQQNHRSLSRFYDSARTRFLEIGEVLPARWQDFLTQIGTNA
jgi:tetratricopeptide (TPR) repeat protein